MSPYSSSRRRAMQAFYTCNIWIICRDTVSPEHNCSTLSIAVPSSVIENAQTAELATCLSGQIARTAAIFNVDEVVVIDESFSRYICYSILFTCPKMHR